MTGSLRRRGSGNHWEITIELPKSSPGKRNRKSISFEGTKRQAEAALVNALAERNRGVHWTSEETTLAEYLDRWFREYALNSVRPSTQQRYRAAIDGHIVPHIGSIRLDRLRPVDVQNMHSMCIREGLAAQTIVNNHRTLSKALKDAVSWQLVPSNAANGARPPRPTAKEMRTLDRAQAVLLIETAKGTALGPMISLALQTGLRIGELLALRWSDVDLENGRLSVRRTVQRITGAGLVFGPTKSHRSGRAIDLPPSCVHELLAVRHKQQEVISAIGVAYRNNDLVFAQPLGNAYEPGQISRAFAKMLDKAGLRRIRFHDLRHTHATLLLGEGMHVKIVSERLGHATTALTLDRYSHVLPSMQEEAARALERIFGPRPLPTPGQAQTAPNRSSAIRRQNQ
jgi:integrase